MDAFSHVPVDYLVIGHLTRDLRPDGDQLGGTAVYAALTARAFGLRVGIVTAFGDDLPPLPSLDGLYLQGYTGGNTTTFENRVTGQRREQVIHNRGEHLYFHMIPEAWRRASIVHLGPVAQEVDPTLVRHFSNALLGITPQGWLREWDADGRVRLAEWPEAAFVLPRAGAVVLSEEDLNHDRKREREIAVLCRLLVVTCGAAGARVHWQGEERLIAAPPADEVDATGAGDIFAAAFFIRLWQTRDPWHAAEIANALAARSVTRIGLAGAPTAEEVAAILHSDPKLIAS